MLAYKLIPIIRKAADDIGMDDDKTEDLYLDFPTDSHFGDLATNLALRVSSVLKKPPIAIAEDLSYRIKKHLKDSPLN